MSTSSAKAANTIVVQVLVPQDVAAADRAEFESAVAEFLFGIDRPRPELHAELEKRGVSLNGLAAASARTTVGVCPDPAALQFIPSRALARHGASVGVSFTSGGTVHVECEYGQASKEEYPSDALLLNLKLPQEFHKNLTDELTGHIVTALFGDCELPDGAQAYLDAHGVDISEVAHKVSADFRDKKIPPTTRVSPMVADKLKRGGFNVNQFGKIHVKSVAAL